MAKLVLWLAVIAVVLLSFEASPATNLKTPSMAEAGTQGEGTVVTLAEVMEADTLVAVEDTQAVATVVIPAAVATVEDTAGTAVAAVTMEGVGAALLQPRPPLKLQRQLSHRTDQFDLITALLSEPNLDLFGLNESKILELKVLRCSGNHEVIEVEVGVLEI
ncbi:hypothetical protein V2J09_020789 [Rumex salicifolius]